MAVNLEKLTTGQKIESVKAVYDAIAPNYAKDFYLDPSDNEYIDIFLSRLTGANILDAGCGIGEDCKYVEEKGTENVNKLSERYQIIVNN